MKKFMISLAVFCAMFFFVSCGGSEDKNGENTGVDTDSGEVSDAEGNDSDVADSEAQNTDEPKELDYPEVTPTSNKEGDIAQNVIMYDDLDMEHSLAEWYNKNNPSSKLIWLVFTTYDCPPCHVLKGSLLKINKKEYRDKGLNIVLIFNGLLTGPQPELEPAKLSETKELYLWGDPDTAEFAVYAYLKKQALFKKFADSENGIAYPTWAFIDANTMEILIYGQGWDESMETGIMNDIEFILDEI